MKFTLLLYLVAAFPANSLSNKMQKNIQDASKKFSDSIAIQGLIRTANDQTPAITANPLPKADFNFDDFKILEKDHNYDPKFDERVRIM